MNSFLSELKRRNVYKVAVAYAVVAWLVIQKTKARCQSRVQPAAGEDCYRELRG